MWWLIIIVAFIFMMIAAYTFEIMQEEHDQMTRDKVPDSDPKKKRIGRTAKIALIVGMILFCIPILYVLGWLWYIFCGGFLLWMEDVWYMKIVYGFMSLIFLSILIGVIAIIFGGWEPYK